MTQTRRRQTGSVTEVGASVKRPRRNAVDGAKSQVTVQSTYSGGGRGAGGLRWDNAAGLGWFLAHRVEGVRTGSTVDPVHNPGGAPKQELCQVGRGGVCVAPSRASHPN